MQTMRVRADDSRGVKILNHFACMLTAPVETCRWDLMVELGIEVLRFVEVA